MESGAFLFLVPKPLSPLVSFGLEMITPCRVIPWSSRNVSALEIGMDCLSPDTALLLATQLPEGGVHLGVGEVVLLLESSQGKPG